MVVFNLSNIVLIMKVGIVVFVVVMVMLRVCIYMFYIISFFWFM